MIEERNDLYGLELYNATLTGHQLSTDEKYIVAKFFASCIGNMELNKRLSEKEELFDSKGNKIEKAAISLVLDFTFLTRNIDKLDLLFAKDLDAYKQYLKDKLHEKRR